MTIIHTCICCLIKDFLYMHFQFISISTLKFLDYLTVSFFEKIMPLLYMVNVEIYYCAHIVDDFGLHLSI